MLRNRALTKSAGWRVMHVCSVVFPPFSLEEALYCFCSWRIMWICGPIPLLAYSALVTSGCLRALSAPASPVCGCLRPRLILGLVLLLCGHSMCSLRHRGGQTCSMGGLSPFPPSGYESAYLASPEGTDACNRIWGQPMSWSQPHQSTSASSGEAEAALLSAQIPI